MPVRCRPHRNSLADQVDRIGIAVRTNLRLMEGIAQAQPNIALVKYWGKQRGDNNVPSTPSLSITLDALWTRTRVEFSGAHARDVFIINEKSDEAQRQRVARCLDHIRQATGRDLHALVESRNNFPTGAGLASSASGFSALVTAACAALDADLDRDQRSRLARMSSASAARSMLGGFVELDVTETDPAARALLDQRDWPLEVLVAVTSTNAKSVGSTQGMLQSAATSAFYAAWTDSAGDDFTAARRAVLARDFQSLAEVSEASCLKMHGVMLTTKPALIYWNGATVEIIHRVRALRSQGTPAFFTIDAGPQVKVVTEAEFVDNVRQAIEDIPGVVDIVPSALGAGARVVDEF